MRRVVYHPTEQAPLTLRRWMQTELDPVPLRPNVIARIASATPGDADELLRVLDEYEGELLRLLEANDDADPPVRSWRGLLLGGRARPHRRYLQGEFQWVVVARRRIREFMAARVMPLLAFEERLEALPSTSACTSTSCSTTSRSRSRPEPRRASGACGARASRRCCGSQRASSCRTRASCASRGATSRSCPTRERARLVRTQIGLAPSSWRETRNVRVVEHVALPLLSGGASMREASVAARAVLERVGATGRADAPIFELSPGERTRVAIARALVRDPALLLRRRAGARRRARPSATSCTRCCARSAASAG